MSELMNRCSRDIPHTYLQTSNWLLPSGDRLCNECRLEWQVWIGLVVRP
jgi:hypothetical protein